MLAEVRAQPRGATFTTLSPDGKCGIRARLVLRGHCLAPRAFRSDPEWERFRGPLR
jgi:hypothetical protein